jgi:alkanesulfonate monooxygenase SsuD/methylene tetrahydromethanopterin reductase-like flavin-dependent oxidoreductase (luciferase family)
MFEERIDILKKCWADSPFEHTGEFLPHAHSRDNGTVKGTDL